MMADRAHPGLNDHLRPGRLGRHRGTPGCPGCSGGSLEVPR
jgi:hypothetical protein